MVHRNGIRDACGTRFKDRLRPHFVEPGADRPGRVKMADERVVAITG